MYDILAGKENMETSYWMGKGKALEAFPMLKGDGLVGGVVYYDGESWTCTSFTAIADPQDNTTTPVWVFRL